MDKKLTFRILDSFNKDIELLRQQHFPGYELNMSSKDDDDDFSAYLVIFANDILIATVRITKWPISVIKKWSNNQGIYPNSNSVAELTRTVIHKDYRGLGIYNLLIVKALLTVLHMNQYFALAAIEHDFPMMKYLFSIGWNYTSEDIVILKETDTIITQCQIISNDLRQNETLLKQKEEDYTLLLKKKGYQIVNN